MREVAHRGGREVVQPVPSLASSPLLVTTDPEVTAGDCRLGRVVWGYTCHHPRVKPPRTADGDHFRFRAGRPILDFCSTQLWRHRDPVERLRLPRDVAGWLAEGWPVPQAPAVTKDELSRAKALREAAYHLFHTHLADEALPAADLDIVNTSAAQPSPAPGPLRECAAPDAPSCF